MIASLNGVTPGAWVEHASLLEEAGADALELNIYYVSSRPGLSGGEVEGNYLELVRAVRQTIGIPLAVKLSPYFSSVANLTRQLVQAGADGLVLFNRFYQPDLDLETLEVTPRLELSTSEELRLPLRWIAILYKEVPASLAASTGVHTAADAVKALMAGADVAMMTSALLRHGPEHLTAVEAGLRDWLDEHGMQSVGHLRGLRSQRSIRDPAAWDAPTTSPCWPATPTRSTPRRADSGVGSAGRARARSIRSRPSDPLLPKPDQGHRDLRSWGAAQVDGAVALSVVVRSGPAETAVNGTLVARLPRDARYPVAPLGPP